MVSPLNKVYERASAIFQKQFFKDSFWTTFFSGLSSAIGLVYFVILARYLGAEGYGVFVGVKAIWAIVFPFIGLGMKDILVQQVSRDTSKFSQCWGDTLLALVFSVVLALLTTVPVVALVLPDISPLFILLIFLGDFLGHTLCMLSKCAFIAVHRIKEASQYSILYMLFKLISVMCLPLFPSDQRLIAWGLLYFIGSLIPGIILLLLVERLIGSPKFDMRSFDLSQIKQGFFFSLSASAVTINSEVDRTMLVAIDTPIAAGLYGAGYRFIDIGFLPIMSVLGASYARFFKYGEIGIKGTLGFARKLLPAAILYGIASAIALIAFSPYVPIVLGEEFVEASAVLVWLSPLHLLGGVQFLAADALTGAGFQRSRSFVQVGAAVLNVGLNLVFIPLFSWKGAIWATLTSETFKLIALWLVVASIYFKTARSAKN